MTEFSETRDSTLALSDPTKGGFESQLGRAGSALGMSVSLHGRMYVGRATRSEMWQVRTEHVQHIGMNT
jgi:hypothetical protein